jgi:chromate transport protein ChrA
MLPACFARLQPPLISNVRAHVSSLAARFIRIAFWCWLAVFVALLVFTVLWALSHGMVDFSRSNTWLAFAQSAFFSALWAVPLALFLAVLILWALFLRRARCNYRLPHER